MEVDRVVAGVEVLPRKVFSNSRGWVMRMLRNDDPVFTHFGEIYFSVVRPGQVKGWHLHTRMTCHYVGVAGRIRLVLYDERMGSPTEGMFQMVDMYRDRHVLVRIPPGIWNAFHAMGGKEGVIANCTDIPHDPSEVLTEDPFSGRIPFGWDLGQEVREHLPHGDR